MPAMETETMSARERVAGPKSVGGTMALVAGGFITGLAVAAGAVWTFMPGMMLVTHASPHGFDETVARLHAALEQEGWASPGTLDMNAALAKHGEELGPRVKVVQLCKAPYARRVLEDRRDVSSMMPCAIAVWEDDAGGVRVSKLNTGLMGRMFGGTVGTVMGGPVAAEEARILARLTEP